MVDRFRFRGGRGIAFRHPCGPAGEVPRTAVLLPGFRCEGKVRVFTPSGPRDRSWLRKLAAFEPQCLAGSVEQLLYFANWKGSPALAPLTHSLVAIQRPGRPWLTERERDILWSVHGLPLFEQLYGEDGLLASECEAHDGLHIAPDADWTVGPRRELWRYEPVKWWEDRRGDYVPSGLFGTVDPSPCACGRKSPRLRLEAAAELPLLLTS